MSSTSIIHEYLRFENQSIGSIPLARLPQHLESTIQSNFTTVGFILPLTAPLRTTIAATRELYKLHFQIPSALTSERAKLVRERILLSLQRNSELWLQFSAALMTFAETELVNIQAPLQDGRRIIRDPAWSPPLPSPTQGLKILEETMWVSPIKRFIDVLNGRWRAGFGVEVDGYTENAASLIVEITQLLEEQKG